jgi:hypothetical protein
MSVTYRRDLPTPVVIITWPRIFPDIQVVQSTMETILADSDRPREFGVVSDWRVSTDAPSIDYVQAFLSLLNSWGRHGLRRWATVVARDSTASFGMGRMVEIRAEEDGVAYRVFRDYDDALAWVGTGARSGTRDQR